MDLLFRVFGIPASTRPVQIMPRRFERNDTTYLNIVFLLMASLVWWPYRNRFRLDGVDKYAKYVVCGIQVEHAQASATDLHEGIMCYFYSVRSHDKFVAELPKYLEASGIEPMTSMGAEVTSVTAGPSLAFRRQPSCQDKQ